MQISIEMMIFLAACGFLGAYVIGYRVGYCQGLKSGALAGWLDAKGRYIERID